MSVKNLIRLATLFVFVVSMDGTSLPALASITSMYVAQGAQGANDGSSCANARAASWFNTSSNWGTGADQIGPGTTVFLCGTIAGNLTFQGSGNTSNYITVDGTQATMNGSFAAGPRISYGRIQDVRWVDNFGAAAQWSPKDRPRVFN